MTMRASFLASATMPLLLAALASGCPKGPTEAPRSTARPSEPSDFSFVIVADRPYAILGDGRELVDDARPLRSVWADHGWHVLVSPLAGEAIPTAMRTVTEATFTVVDLEGHRCHATAESVVLLASVFEPDELLDPESAVGAETLAELEAKHEGGGTAAGAGAVMIAAPLRVDDELCAVPQWAWNEAANLPYRVTPKPAPPELEQQVLAAMRALPEVQAIQARYVEEAGGEGHWTEVVEDEPPAAGEEPEPPRVGFDGLALQRRARVVTFDSPHGEPLVMFSVRNGGVCGDFWGAATLVWSLADHGALSPKPVRAAFDYDAIVPDEIIDVDEDGTYELLERSRFHGELSTTPPRRFGTAILQPC